MTSFSTKNWNKGKEVYETEFSNDSYNQAKIALSQNQIKDKLNDEITYSFEGIDFTWKC